jgi:multidrug efflux pump subunit AcrA (membrane-fusion protein)
MKHSMTLIAISALLTVVSCQKSKPQQQTTTAPVVATATSAIQPAVPAPAAATEEIGHYAENLYDWGKIGDWPKAESDLIALKSAVLKLETTGQVTDLVAAIEKAVQVRRALTLMHAANDLTRVAAEINRPFNPTVPVEVTLLDYYGRELELWAEEGNAAKLNETRSKLQETWDTVRPSVVAKGGNIEASQFDALVAQLTKATTANDFAATATPILDSVDLLENVFTRA